MARQVRSSGAPGSGDWTGISPIVQDSTPSLIAGQLREAIASGEFKPGQQLQEVALASRLNVSRGPLREAMQRLTQEGLLVSHRNRGLFVMDLDEAAIRDIYLARAAVERAAVQALIGTGAGERAEALLTLVDQMRDYADDPANPDVSGLDMLFHKRLVELSASPRLIRMHQTLLTQVRLCLAWMEGSYDTIDLRVTEHQGIAQAIIDGDAASADRLLLAHMDDGLERVLSMVLAH